MDKSNENQQALEQRNKHPQTVKKKHFLINLLFKGFLKGVSFIANIERILSFWERFDQ